MKQILTRVISGIIIAAAAVYLANLSFGIDLLPDNLPLIGNLDEAAATALLMWGVKNWKEA